MNRQFLANNQALLKRGMLWYLVGVVVMVVALAIVASVLPEEWEKISIWRMTAHQFAVNIGIALFALSVLGGIFIIGMRYDIKCPNCKKSIQGGNYTRIAITSGKCGHCGNQIVDDVAPPPSEPPSPPSPTIEPLEPRRFL